MSRKIKKKIKTFLYAFYFAFIAVYLVFFIQTYRGKMFAVELEEEKVYEFVDFGGYKWRVLDVQDERTLLLMENIWDFRPYHNEREEITWERSYLRQILNNEFYYSFPQADREKIIKTSVSTPNNHWFRTDGGADTEDYVFLLSLEEIVNYLGDSGQFGIRQIPRNHISDQYNGARRAYDLTGNIEFWWSRSPGNDANRASNVTHGGGVNMFGIIVSNGGGVRPALWLLNY